MEKQFTLADLSLPDSRGDRTTLAFLPGDIVRANSLVPTMFDMDSPLSRGRMQGGGSTPRSSQYASSVNVVFTRQIVRASDSGDVGEILSFVDKNFRRLNTVNLATALHRIAKIHSACRRLGRSRFRADSADDPPSLLEDPRFARLLQGVTHAVISAASECEPPCLGDLHQPWTISITAWSLANLGVGEGISDIFAGLAKLSVAHVCAYKPVELSNTVWSFAKLFNGENFQLFRVFADACTQQLPFFNPQGLSTALWSLATASRTEKSEEISIFFKAAETHLLCRMGEELKPQELANIFWSFAVVGSGGTLLTRLVPAVLARIGGYKPAELATILWSVASVYGRFPPPAALAVFNAISAELSITPLVGYSPPLLASILGSFSLARNYHPVVWGRLGSCLATGVAELGVGDLLALIDVMDGDIGTGGLCEAIHRELARRSEFEGAVWGVEGFIRILHAFSRIGLRSPPILRNASTTARSVSTTSIDVLVNLCKVFSQQSCADPIFFGFVAERFLAITSSMYVILGEFLAIVQSLALSEIDQIRVLVEKLNGEIGIGTLSESDWVKFCGSFCRVGGDLHAIIRATSRNGNDVEQALNNFTELGTMEDWIYEIGASLDSLDSRDMISFQHAVIDEMIKRCDRSLFGTLLVVNTFLRCRSCCTCFTRLLDGICMDSQMLSTSRAQYILGCFIRGLAEVIRDPKSGCGTGSTSKMICAVYEETISWLSKAFSSGSLKSSPRLALDLLASFRSTGAVATDSFMGVAEAVHTGLGHLSLIEIGECINFFALVNFNYRPLLREVGSLLERIFVNDGCFSFSEDTAFQFAFGLAVGRYENPALIAELLEYSKKNSCCSFEWAACKNYIDSIDRFLAASLTKTDYEISRSFVREEEIKALCDLLRESVEVEWVDQNGILHVSGIAIIFDLNTPFFDISSGAWLVSGAARLQFSLNRCGLLVPGIALRTLGIKGVKDLILEAIKDKGGVSPRSDEMEERVRFLELD